MAIAFDNSIAQQTNGGTSSLSFSYTTTGSNLYLFVGAIIQSGQTISGVTYAGVSMTQISSILTDGVSVNEASYLFGLAAPATGANNVIVTGSAAATIAAVASSYTGAQQTTTVEANNTNTGNSTAATVSVTTVTDNDWLVNFYRSQQVGTAGSNTTIRNSSAFSMTDSNGVQTPPGSFSQNLSLTSAHWLMMAAALKPFSAAAAAVHLPYLNLTGVGQ